MNNFVLDIETTGLNANKHEIIEIALVHYNPVTLMPTGVKFTSYIKPLRPEFIDPDAIAINGLDTELLLRQPTPGQVRMALLQWKQELYGDDKIYLLGHNVSSFDRSFMKVFLKDWYDRIFDYHMLDTSVIVTFLKDIGLIPKNQNGSLTELVKYFNLEARKAHTAYDDCLSCLDVYRRLVEMMRNNLTKEEL